MDANLDSGLAQERIADDILRRWCNDHGDASVAA